MLHDKSFSHLLFLHLTSTILASLCLLSATSSVFAQLSETDIAELQQRGIDEGWTFTVAHNPACQYSLKVLSGTIEPADWQETARFDPCVPTRDLPAAFDWRDSATFTQVQTQDSCGSCWAFATAGTLECAIAIEDDTAIDLSEEYLVNCNLSGWTCQGGWAAHDYYQFRSDHCGDTGAVLESSYPYTATDTPCGCPFYHPYRIHSWFFIGTQHSYPSVSSLKQAILDHGPVTVCVRTNSAFHAYNGGIFNACEDSSINHMVVLVGWDDNQGESGVWFMRNSWGDWWGEDGYCRIEYDCSRIGYGASYIRYRPIQMTPKDTLAPVPMTVSFSASARGETADSCEWDFGDGHEGSGLSPVHEYIEPGYYSVLTRLFTPEEVLEYTFSGWISAYADTMTIASVGTNADTQVRVDVSARNYLPLKEITLPISWAGDLDLQYDSFSTAGLRTDGIVDARLANYDFFGKRFILELNVRTVLGNESIDPGDSPIISLWFTVPSAAPGTSNPIVLTSYAGRSPTFVTYAGEYLPETVDGGITTGCCIDTRGNVQTVPYCYGSEQNVDISDLTELISHLFINFGPLCCNHEADIAPAIAGQPPDGSVDVGDLTALIDHLFITFPELPDCY